LRGGGRGDQQVFGCQLLYRGVVDELPRAGDEEQGAFVGVSSAKQQGASRAVVGKHGAGVVASNGLVHVNEQIAPRVLVGAGPIRDFPMASLDHCMG
jgi:hypothetical protein